jgi:hypothetical protein
MRRASPSSPAGADRACISLPSSVSVEGDAWGFELSHRGRGNVAHDFKPLAGVLAAAQKLRHRCPRLRRTDGEVPGFKCGSCSKLLSCCMNNLRNSAFPFNSAWRRKRACSVAPDIHNIGADYPYRDLVQPFRACSRCDS